MEGMRHKLSLPGLGMSKCTDPSGAAGCRVLEAVCRLPRDTTPQTAELRGVREVQDGRDSACMYIRYSIRVVLKYCTVRVENKCQMGPLTSSPFYDPCPDAESLLLSPV